MLHLGAAAGLQGLGIGVHLREIPGDQSDLAAEAGVHSVEGAAAVNGHGVQGLGRGGTGGHFGDLGEDAVHHIHGVEAVAAVGRADGALGLVGHLAGQGIELLIRGVIGKIQHRLALVQGGEAAHLPGILQILLGRGIEAVVGGEEDVAAIVLRGVDGLVGGRHHGGTGKVIDAGVVQGSGIDLDPALVLAAVGAVVEAENAAGEVLGRAAVLHLVADLVSGVVRQNHGDILAHGIIQGEGDAAELARLVLLGDARQLVAVLVGQDLLAAGIVDADVGDILVILGQDGELAGEEILVDPHGLGGGAIHGVGAREEGAAAQLAGGDELGDLLLGQGTVLLIVLGDQDIARGELVALLETQGGDLQAASGRGAGLLPLSTVGVVVGAGELFLETGGVDDLAGSLVLHEVHDRRRVADDAHVVAGEGAAGVEGRAVIGDVLHGIALDGIGVDGVDILALIAGVLDGDQVGLVNAQVGGPVIAVEPLHVGGGIQHGGVRPVAVEAQQGDGVGGQDGAVLGAGGLGVDIALHVSAVEIGGIQLGLLGLGELDADGDVHLAAGGNHHGGGGHALEQELRVVGGDGLVAVEVGHGEVAGRAGRIVNAGDVIQDALGVQGVGDAVAVDIRLHRGGGDEGLAVHGVGHTGGQGSRPGVQEVGGVAGGIVLLLEDSLGEELRGEGVVLSRIGEVIQGEAEAVRAGALRVVAELGLDLAVGGGAGEVILHQDVGAGGDGAAHVGKARALIQDGVGQAGGFLDDGLRRGHQQAVGELTDGEAGLGGQAVLPDVLGHHGGHTGHLGRRHGGAGHGLVGAVAGVRAVALVGAVDGVDAAAGGGDLRLQLQAAGDAPGGEVAHGVVIGVVVHGADAVGNGHRAGGILAVLRLGGSRPDGQAVRLGDGHAGRGLGVAGEIHADGAGGVVVNHGGNGAGVDGVRRLLGEGDAAALDEDHLAGDVDALKVAGIAGNTGRQDHILLLPLQGGEGGVLVAGLGVAHQALTHGEVAAGEAVVIHGGNCQGVGEGAGGAVGLHGNIVGVEVPGLGVLRPVAGVACGHADHGAGLGDAVHDLGVILAHAAEAGGAGAQGQVHAVAAQDDGVLNGGHVVGVIGTAIGAEDLHDHQLGVGGHALHLHALQGGDEAVILGDVGVGGGDAGHVGAVLTLLVAHVIHGVVLVDIVIREGDLGVQVDLVGGDLDVQALENVLRQAILGQDAHAGLVLCQGLAVLQVLGQGVLIPRGGEGLLRRVQAGIDDGDLAARAGVACCPSSAGADLGGGGRHAGIVGLGLIHHHGLIAVLDQDGLDAPDALDLPDLVIADVGGDDVGGQRQVPDHIEAVIQLGVDPLGDALLLALEAVAVGDSGGAELGGAKLLDGGGVLQHDGDTDDVIGRVVRLLPVRSVQLGGGELGGSRPIHLLKLQVLGGPVSRAGRDDEAQAQHHCQKQSKDPTCVFLHVRSFPFL